MSSEEFKIKAKELGIKDKDIKKELEVNLVSARNKINDLLNEINLEKYNYENIIEVEIM